MESGTYSYNLRWLDIGDNNVAQCIGRNPTMRVRIPVKTTNALQSQENMKLVPQNKRTHVDSAKKP